MQLLSVDAVRNTICIAAGTVTRCSASSVLHHQVFRRQWFTEGPSTQTVSENIKTKKWLYISTGDPNPPITPKLSLNPNVKLTITLTLFLAFNPRFLALVYSQKHLLVVIYLCHNLFVVKPIKLPPMDQPGVSVTRIRVKTLLRLVVGLGSLWLVLG